MDDWKLLELAFDLLENAKEGERTGQRIFLSVDFQTWELFKHGLSEEKKNDQSKTNDL